LHGDVLVWEEEVGPDKLLTLRHNAPRHSSKLARFVLPWRASHECDNPHECDDQSGEGDGATVAIGEALLFPERIDASVGNWDALPCIHPPFSHDSRRVILTLFNWRTASPL
jgi:hypothetical protein